MEQTFILQQIEHGTLLDLDTLLNPSNEGKQSTSAPHEHVMDHEHDHTHETPLDSETLPSQQLPQPNAKHFSTQLEIPPALHTPEAINRWFTALDALHSGQLPKDLQALQKVITELEKIRQEGEANLKPPQPPVPSLPPKAVPPEGSSPPTPDEDD